MARYTIKPMNTTDGKRYRIYQKIGKELSPSRVHTTYYKTKKGALRTIKKHGEL